MTDKDFKSRAITKIFLRIVSTLLDKLETFRTLLNFWVSDALEFWLISKSVLAQASGCTRDDMRPFLQTDVVDFVSCLVSWNESCPNFFDNFNI